MKVTKEFFIGHGNCAFGFMDTFLDRLFEYIGSKEVYHVRFFFSYPYMLHKYNVFVALLGYGVL